MMMASCTAGRGWLHAQCAAPFPCQKKKKKLSVVRPPCDRLMLGMCNSCVQVPRVMTVIMCRTWLKLPMSALLLRFMANTASTTSYNSSRAPAGGPSPGMPPCCAVPCC